jgi:hypothetical protein
VRVPSRWFASVVLAVATALPACAADDERGRLRLPCFGRLEHKAPALFHAPFSSPAGLYYAGNQLAPMA